VNGAGLAGSRLPGLAAAGVLLVTAAACIALRRPEALLVPAGLLAAVYAFDRALTRPALVLAPFLLVIVNLDYLKLGGSGISLDILLSVLLLALFVLRHLLARAPATRPGLEAMFVLFLLAAGLSVLVSVDPGQSARRLGREFEYLVLFAFLLRNPISWPDRRLLLGAIMLSSVVPCVLGIAGYALGIDAFLGQELYLESLYSGEARARATLSHPVTFSLYLTVVFTLTLAFLMEGRRFPRRFTAPLALLQLVALYVTYGRTGWIAFGAGALTLLWIRGVRKRLLFGLPFVLVAAWRIVPNFQERWITATSMGEENSLVWRLGLWAAALDKFPDRPILGSGIGTFLEYVDYLEGFGPHQTWVGLLVETGVLGAILFLGLLVAAGVALARERRRRPGDPLVDGAFAAWAGMMVGSLGANAFGLPSVVVYYWAVLGLALASAPLPGARTTAIRPPGP
jgi:O-antigen ligase